MSYLVGDNSALFRAHNTSSQTGVLPGQMFAVQFADQCEIDANNQIVLNNQAYLYGELRATNLSIQTYDASFNQFSTLESQGWQLASDVAVGLMVGDDGMYGVSKNSSGLTMRNRFSSYTGGADISQTRIFGVRMR